MAKAQRKAHKRLKARKERYDRLSDKYKVGTRRPGSMNKKKGS